MRRWSICLVSDVTAYGKMGVVKIYKGILKVYESYGMV
jgi:hypothetical protein